MFISVPTLGISDEILTNTESEKNFKRAQAFIEESLERIQTLRKMLDEKGLKTHIQVDGGINQETGKKVKEAGADVLVAGSYIFKNDIHIT